MCFRSNKLSLNLPTRFQDVAASFSLLSAHDKSAEYTAIWWRGDSGCLTSSKSRGQPYVVESAFEG